MHAKQWCVPYSQCLRAACFQHSNVLSKPWRPNDQEANTGYTRGFIVRIVPIKPWITFYRTRTLYCTHIKPIRQSQITWGDTGYQQNVISPTCGLHENPRENTEIHIHSIINYIKKHTLLHCHCCVKHSWKHGQSAFIITKYINVLV